MRFLMRSFSSLQISEVIQEPAVLRSSITASFSEEKIKMKPSKVLEVQ